MPESIDNIEGRPAIETDQPMSIQEASLWAVEQRSKADARKAAIERLKCAAAKRRERKPANPLETLKPDPSYKVGGFNPEADAFNVEGSDGKKLLGKSISNGNVKSGQKVRSFFTPNGQVVIDVKPKGRDIVIPKPEPKPPVEDEEFWPVISCFLYSRIKDTQERLTGNFATNITSWDTAEIGYSGSTRVNLFLQLPHNMGDYETGVKAVLNEVKEDRKLKPSGPSGSGGSADNAAWASGSPDAVIVWFFIGNPASMHSVAATNKIIKVEGRPAHPNAGSRQNFGPGFCLVVTQFLGNSACVFPSDETIGEGPLTKQLKASFPNLGGTIGYWGTIWRWGGEVDYTSTVNYARHAPYPNETVQTPTSYPEGYVPGGPLPWYKINSEWFRFGWGTPPGNPQKIAVTCSSHVNVNTSAINALSGCGGAVPPESWYWGANSSPYVAIIDGYGDYWDGRDDVTYVCWKGHKDNIGMAQSFFEAFRQYWGIPGTVTRLASCNPYGCGVETPGGGTDYPPAPTGPARYLLEAWGRKAEILLKCCWRKDLILEVKIPLEFAAVVERYIAPADISIGNIGASNIKNTIQTFASGFPSSGSQRNCLENPHGTLGIDGEFAYVNISYGCERIWEEPLTKPIPTMLDNLGAALFNSRKFYREPGVKETLTTGIVGYVVGEYVPPTIAEILPRYKKDCFSYCLACKIKLPTEADKTLTIVETRVYRRGEPIAITAKSPDTEFDNKYLIHDFRTNRRENNPLPAGSPAGFTFAPWQFASAEYASFGGLPALLQFPRQDFPIALTISNMPKFYKPQDTWSALDWVHFQLLEKPRLYDPTTEILPSGVKTASDTLSRPYNLIFDLDKRFGRNGRADKISNPALFSYSSDATPAPAVTFNRAHNSELLFISHKEQLIGNGLIENNKLTKWFRLTKSSFPIDGQFARDNQ
jgi:hypothetical protein